MNPLGFNSDIIDEQDELDMEFANVRVAITAMMISAEVNELDDSYYGVDTMAEVQAVTAGDGLVNLYEFLMYSEYPLKQAYDIDVSGAVTTG